MKYLVAEVAMGKIRAGQKPTVMLVPFIFPNMMVHSLMVSAIGMVCAAHNWELIKVRSGGFADVFATCSGGSETVGVEHDPRDDTLINMNDYGVGIM